MTKIRKFLRRPKAKELSLHRRHLALTARMRIELKRLVEMMAVTGKLIATAHTRKQKRKLKIVIRKLFFRLHAIYSPPSGLFEKLEHIEHVPVGLDDFNDQDIPTYFRFKNKNQLRRIIQGFRVDEWMTCRSGHKFTGVEVCLVGLYRLHRPTSLGDACWKYKFRLDYQSVSKCFNLFLRHMCDYWEFLPTDNLSF
jgi:hypothetical protein